jgi:ribonuclease M5
VDAYIPDLYGKEKRKVKASKEGKIGVEGMRPEVLLDALIKAGATVDDVCNAKDRKLISKADMYARGLSGKPGSTECRRKLLEKLELPERMTADALLDVLNAIMDRDEFFAIQL